MNEKREILGYSPIEIETTTTPTNEPTDTTE
jgi:hypothetical protein